MTVEWRRTPNAWRHAPKAADNRATAPANTKAEAPRASAQYAARRLRQAALMP